MIVTRFAPSPTGYLHLGHAFAAFTARAAGERFHLRIEDIDRLRCRPEYELAVFEDLAWLGIAWDGAATRQSERFATYAAALERLAADGLTYPCFCTRREIAGEIARSVDAPSGPEGHLYPGTCRALPAQERQARIAGGEAYAVRLDVHEAARRIGPLFFDERGAGPNGEHGAIAVEPFLFGDVVLSRKDTPVSYQLAAVVDDAFQGVTLVTRGNDLFHAAHIQRLLQALLRLSAPDYAHHRLILDDRGRKFAKRDRAVTLRSLRDAGVTPAEIRARLQV
ncbi:MAG: tRNA glutamyl-Q(34) synthetase GluQRS [Rhizomicrobium sp.]